MGRTIPTAVVSGLMPGTRVNLVSDMEPYTTIRCTVAKHGGHRRLHDTDTGVYWKILTYVTYHYELPEDEAHAKVENKDMNEDKQEICDNLLAALFKTRAGGNLLDIIYTSSPERVTLRYINGRERKINVAGDSGIEMIREIASCI